MRRVAISAASRRSADAGAAVADAGGNAVDAAIASTVAGMISEPGLIGPGAGCFLTIWPPDGDPVVIDAYVAMPGIGAQAAPSDFGTRIHMDYGGGMETLVGPSSVAVPGAWEGFGKASSQFGAVPWETIMAPAIAIAEDGFPLSSVSEAYLSYSHDPIYDIQPESSDALHRPDGSRVADGDLIVIEGLGDSLRTIATEGPGSFLTGTIGQRLLEAMGEWGGHITPRDLEEYEAIERIPIEADIDGWRIVTNPAPAVGGAVLAAIVLLAHAAGFDRWESDTAATFAKVQRAVLGYRSQRLDGAAELAGPIAELLDAAGGGDLGDLERLTSSPSTIHSSAVDTAGLACSVTTSAGYGSGFMIPGTGLWLNNSLGEVDLLTKGMDVFGPGDRLVSNMAPTIALGPSGSKLALGSPGASRITTSLAQVLLNYISMEMSVTDAIHHPRLHVEVFEGKPTIAYEPGIHLDAFDDFVLRRFPDLSMYFGGVGLAMFHPDSGLYETADPRRVGATAVGGL